MWFTKWNLGFVCLVYSLCITTNDALVPNEGVTFNISSYNASDESTFIFKQYVEFVNNTPLQVQVVDIPKKVGFFIIELHSFLENVHLNTSDSLSSIFGSDIGLVEITENNKTNRVYWIGSPSSAIENEILVVVRVYSIDDPIPGGCNSEFPGLSMAPYQIINASNANILKVELQPSQANGEICDKNVVEVDLYHMYLEGRMNTSDHFAAIESFLTTENIVKYGRKISPAHPPAPYRKYYNTYGRTGAIYAAVARYKNRSTPYVSAISYNCEFSNVNSTNSCDQPLGHIWSWLLGILLFTGLGVCFVGHKFLSFTLFFIGFVVGDLVLFMIFPNGLGISVVVDLFLMTLVGFCAGISFLLLWVHTAVPIMSILPTFFITGLLISSIVFYAGLEDIHVYVNSLNYWGTMVCITLMVMMLLSFVTVPGSIIASSFLGAYATVVPIDHYIGSHLRFIFITPIRRATEAHFNEAVIDPPYQTEDFYATGLWAILTIVGALIQWQTNKNRAPFPNPVRLFFKRQGVNENTPLLSSQANSSDDGRNVRRRELYT